MTSEATTTSETVVAEVAEPAEVTYHCQAAYCPEDNKLRISSYVRLGNETVARLKAAGFKWAPRQEVWVAPMWTPEREDLCVELAGEVGDEDSTLVDRAEERADRFGGYGDNRERDAHAAKRAVDAVADAIPLGQPILVGHHSEKHARKDKERIESGMRKAVKMWETAQYWKDRAAGAIAHAKYKELPAVRHRRIKTIEAERRKQAKELAEYEKLLRFWSQPEIARDKALAVCNCFDRGGVTLPDGESYWSAWGALEDGRVTVEEIRAQRLDRLPQIIGRRKRWVAHCDNRLAYERAMLGESGGIAADKTKPEKGGGVRCWASPGHGRGWSYVKRVNKVSVTVEDNWGNGGKNFTRTVPLDKLTALMPKADVDAARAAGRLAEAADGTGFFLTDAPPPEPRPVYTAPERTEFDAIKDVLASGGVKTVVAPTLFPTPPEVARKVVELAEIAPGMRVLEPSAGTGNLLRALGPLGRFEVVACEISPELADQLCRTWVSCLGVVCGDFIERFSLLDPVDDVGEVKPEMWQFDRVVMNPPFDRGLDVKHVEHALKLLKPGGRLVAVVANGPRQRERLEPLATAWIDLPDDTFKAQGTGVRTAIVVIDGG